MKKAIVIGGAGFIGSNIVDELVDNNWDVHIIDNLSTGKSNNINKKAKFYYIDICTDDFVNLQKNTNVFKDVDVLFHLAAWPRVEPSIKDPCIYNEVNVTGTVAVFDACRRNKINNVIFSSSSSVYGEANVFPTGEDHNLNPMSPYALQKLIGEQYAKMFCELYDMNITCIRYFNVFGKNEPTEGAYVPVVGIWLKQLRNNVSLTITGGGEQSRDFINVANVANANIVCAETGLQGYNVFNVGSGQTHTLNYLASLLSDDVKYIAERNEPKYTLSSIEKIKKETGFVILPGTDIVSYLKAANK